MENSEMIDAPAIHSRSNRRIVLVGSMGVYHKIIEIAQCLASYGINVIVPEAEEEAIRRLDLFEFEEFKRKVSFAYLKKIRDPRTFCIVAINLDRHGILNYIGPNTFAEIAVAFAQSKRVYLYQGMPDAYSDELSAWRSIVLNGNLDRVVTDFQLSCMEEDMQLRLID